MEAVFFMSLRKNDNCKLISRLTPGRLFNMLSLRLSFTWSQLIRKAVHAGMPGSLSIEPTTSCNLRCPGCHCGTGSFTRPRGKMDMALFRKIIDDAGPKLFYLLLYFQGEPFLHPELSEMISIAVSRRIYTATSTNGHFLDEKNTEMIIRSGLNRLIISVDGSTQESYEKYRVNGKLDKVIEGTALLKEARVKAGTKKPFIVWQFLVLRHNEHQIAEVRQMAEKAGVDRFEVKSAQLSPFENGNELMPENPKFSRYLQQYDGTYRIKNRLKNKCKRMWCSAVVTWDCKMVPCCFDKDAEYILGDLSSVSLKEVWKSDQYRQFRQRILDERKNITICNNCTEGLKI
ncbi:MAG: radical SAM/SPASM domain-containing protein [Bacteroidota bacterium]